MNDSKQQSAVEKLRSHIGFPVVYMFVVMLFFASVVVGFARFTAERVAANRQILFERAVLIALGFDVGRDTPPQEIHRLFQSRVDAPTEGSAGAYILEDGDGVAAYALPVAGQGFWDEIKGVVGIQSDGRTLIGVAFYEQKETPGLGAEIVKPYFLKRFKGLPLETNSNPIGLVSVGMERRENEVYAITGATQTCTRLEKILNEALAAWQKKMGMRSP